MQHTSDISGTATLLRDAGGQVALQTVSAGDLDSTPAWNLHDRLGSTIATTTANGRVTDLSDYSDFGVPIFDSTGWAGTSNYTGELSDATTGLNSYFSRTYDAFAGTWLTADDYRGTLENPGSHNRYGYVENNPATMADSLGFRPYNPQGITPTPKVTRPSAAAAQGARLAAYGNAYNKAKASPGGTTVGDSCVGRACGSNIQSDRHNLPYCSPFTLATFAQVNCQMDFRAETMTGKWLDMALLLIPLGLLSGVASKTLGALLQALAKSRITKLPAKEPLPNIPARKGPIPDAVPNSLSQKLALQEARSGHGKPIMDGLGDAPRLASVYGSGEWVKMQWVHRGGAEGNVIIHWFRNKTTNLDVEFKFK